MISCVSSKIDKQIYTRCMLWLHQTFAPASRKRGPKRGQLLHIGIMLNSAGGMFRNAVHKLTVPSEYMGHTPREAKDQFCWASGWTTIKLRCPEMYWLDRFLCQMECSAGPCRLLRIRIYIRPTMSRRVSPNKTRICLAF